MALYAISDLHLEHPGNRQALEALEPHLMDWLILAGDIAESARLTEHALRLATERFAKVIWAPGNHDLWTVKKSREPERGEDKYARLVTLCRELGVLSPEDPYPRYPTERGELIVCPLMVLYDYSFAPEGMSPAEAKAWALEDDIWCTDEVYLHTSPFDDIAAWCAARVELSERRLAELEGAPTVLINHYPLRRDLLTLGRVPRISPWCGTERTEAWHRRFAAEVVVYGHLHVRRTRMLDGVRFEEVSLGYPGDWDRERGLRPYLRRIA